MKLCFCLFLAVFDALCPARKLSEQSPKFVLIFVVIFDVAPVRWPLSRSVVVKDSCYILVGPATTQNLIVKFDGEVCGGVWVENYSDNFSQQKKLETLLPNFAGSSPPISPKTSPTSLWKLLVLDFVMPQGTRQALNIKIPLWRLVSRLLPVLQRRKLVELPDVA